MRWGLYGCEICMEVGSVWRCGLYGHWVCMEAGSVCRFGLYGGVRMEVESL